VCSHAHEPLDFAGALKAEGRWRRLWAWRLVPFLALIWLYKRALSPLLPRLCRFEPTCSEYMFQAIVRRGLFQGLVIGLLRLMRCQPWGGGGYDPVEAFRWPWSARG